MPREVVGWTEVGAEKGMRGLLREELWVWARRSG